MSQFNCLDCERRRAELRNQLDLLIPKITHRALEEQRTYGIYLDTDDRKLYAVPLADCYQRGETPIEIISGYQ